MAALNKNVQSAIMGTLFGTPANFQPSGLYLALATFIIVNEANITGSGFAEPEIQLNYSRVAVPDWTITYDANAGQTTATNTNDIVFPQVQNGNWGYIQGWVLCDSGSAHGGNALVFGKWDTGQLMNNGMTMTISAGDLRIVIA